MLLFFHSFIPLYFFGLYHISTEFSHFDLHCFYFTTSLLFGAMLGGLGGVGMAAGEMIGCKTGMLAVHAVTSMLAIGMLAFDMTSLGYNCQEQLIKDEKIDKRLIPSFIGTPISNANEKAHNNPFYNALQEITFATAAFSAGYVSAAACFVAGTLVATACGLCAIETIRPGDMVLSANTETMETGYKPVVETYVRKVDKLVHLTVNGEEIITTVDHPFYVNGQGFVNAVDLCIGSQLIDNIGNILNVDQIFRESLYDETCDVYNFKVDEWHTYFVGENNVLVHNALNKYDIQRAEQLESYSDSELSSDGSSIHPNVPEWKPGDPCKGVLEVDGAKISLRSGGSGPGEFLKSLPGGKGTGLNAQNSTHVEGHAASIMRQEGISSAELYINKPPCNTGAMCRFNLSNVN